MTAGLHTVNLANKFLNTLSGTSFSVTTCYVQLHTADPGSAGTTSVSAVTTRQTLAWNAAASGSKTASGSPVATWSMTTTETITHISLWDASTSGNFLTSIALSSPASVVNGSTVNLTSLTIGAISPLAA